MLAINYRVWIVKGARMQLTMPPRAQSRATLPTMRKDAFTLSIISIIY